MGWTDGPSGLGWRARGGQRRHRSFDPDGFGRRFDPRPLGRPAQPQERQDRHGVVATWPRWPLSLILGVLAGLTLFYRFGLDPFTAHPQAA